MDIYALIPSRGNKPGKSLNKLVNTLTSWGIHVKLLLDKESIYTAFTDAVKQIPCMPEDIFIMCHDDIEILCNKEHFFRCLAEVSRPNIGFIGVAGTTRLTESGVWWDKENLFNGCGRGSVIHADEIHPSTYGGTGEVVVMDGLFLAATAGDLVDIELSEPIYFNGGWDFYDIMYCHRMRALGKKNMVVPVLLRHHSKGELVGRDGWHFNRKAFVEHHVKGRKYEV